MRRIFALVCLLAAVSPFVRAQSTFGSVTGTVVDPSGAVIRGANVNVQNAGTGLIRSVTTGESGEFLVANLDPGTYVVTASNAGFRPRALEGISLLARQIVRLEMRLEVGAAEQQVIEVAAQGTIVTDSPTIADSKSGREINELALNFRATASTSPLVVATLAPGVQQDRGENISIAGNLPYMTNYTIDGVSALNVRFNGPVRDLAPSVESIGEFKVSSSNNNAEFAQVSDITVVSKGGTNEYHGNAYWFHQNRALNATNPFAPVSGSNPNVRVKPANVANTFGATMGGPVLIPGLYNGKNRTFFFGNYEGVRRASASPLQLTVPPDAFRQGDLSSISTPLVNPLAGLPFPGNRLPVNPTAAGVLNLLYERQNQPTGSAVRPNFILNYPDRYVQDGFDLRGDQNLGEKNKVFVRFSYKDINRTGDDGSGAYNTKAGVYSRRQQLRNLSGSYNSILTPSLINEFRAGWSGSLFRNSYPLAAQGGEIVRQLGITGLPPTPASGGLPNFNFQDGTFISTSPGRPREVENNTYQFNNNLTWIRGRHTFKFGLDYQRVKFRDFLTFFAGDEYGEYFFT